MKKIAVIAIFLGDYFLLWDEYYHSAIDNLFPSDSKSFFVFTDSNYIKTFQSDKINVFMVDNKGWPFHSTMRYDYILSISNELIDYDYAIFYQGNAFFECQISSSVVFDDEHVSVFIHPTMNELHKIKRTYERRRKSTAFTPYNKEPDFYYQAVAFGAKSDIFIKLSEYVNLIMKIDARNSVMAVWYDETYLNKILEYFALKILPSIYIFPESLVKDHNKLPLVIMREKSRYFDVEKTKYGHIGLMNGLINIVSIRIRQFISLIVSLYIK
jgi:hypothetical protein